MAADATGAQLRAVDLRGAFVTRPNNAADSTLEDTDASERTIPFLRQAARNFHI
jgi:hypothetical protein